MKKWTDEMIIEEIKRSDGIIIAALRELSPGINHERKQKQYTLLIQNQNGPATHT